MLLKLLTLLFSSPGGDHKAKAGQGPQEDPGAQGQVSRRWEGEGQIQGGDHREDAGVKRPFAYKINCCINGLHVTSFSFNGL